MIAVYIDLPLFAPPDAPYVLATGELNLPFVPSHTDSFPWPSEWTAALPTCFSKENGAVLATTPWSGGGSAQSHVSLCGIVFEDQLQAQACAQYLESMGLQIHDLRAEA